MTKPGDILPPGLEHLGVGQQTQAEKPRNSLGQDEFFKLMVAQLTNQDPLKPLESNEFLGQVAQFSTVTGVQAMQEAIADLSASFQSSQALQASTMVGRDVLVSGNRALLGGDGTLKAAADLPASTGSLSASIYDARGQLVRQLTLGAHEAGLVEFTWDGLTDAGQQAPAGPYTVAVTATFDDETHAVDSLVAARVESVTLGKAGTGMQLNLAGLGPVDTSQVRQLL